MAELKSTIVGLLACQKDSYLKTLTTTVVKCTEKKPAKKDKKLKDLSLSPQYEVEFQDTVLFPQGGGQPSDSGDISIEADKVAVVDIQRNGLLAKHTVNKPLEVGTKISLTVDWTKRFDHMQQHTGQHLLSAILDHRGLPTLSWKMNPIYGVGDEVQTSDMLNYVEIPRKLSDEEVIEITKEVNNKILDDLPVTVEYIDKDADIETRNITSIPGDYDLSNGVLRVVHIGDIDTSMCCGTHLKSTSQIGSVGIFHQTSVRGQNSKLFFACGSRVYNYSSEIHKILRTIGSTLSCQLNDTVDKVDALNSQYRKAVSNNKSLLEELAQLESANLISQLESHSAPVFYKHYANKSLDFLQMLNRGLNSLLRGSKELPTIVFSTGTVKSTGSVMIFGGTPESVQKVGNELKSCVKTLKGGGKDRWQGKVVAWEKSELDVINAKYA